MKQNDKPFKFDLVGRFLARETPSEIARSTDTPLSDVLEAIRLDLLETRRDLEDWKYQYQELFQTYKHTCPSCGKKRKARRATV